MLQLLNGYEEVSDLEMMMTEGGYWGTGGGWVDDSYVAQNALNYDPNTKSATGYNPVQQTMTLWFKSQGDVYAFLGNFVDSVTVSFVGYNGGLGFQVKIVPK